MSTPNHLGWEGCRGLYSTARAENKAPSMIAVLTNWDYFVESKDGSVYMESVKSCCIWGAKFEGVIAWKENNNSTKGEAL